MHAKRAQTPGFLFLEHDSASVQRADPAATYTS
jgi:hypothetical protein